MTHTIERLARFLAVSRGHLLEGAMPSRRVPRRPSRDTLDDEDGDIEPALPRAPWLERRGPAGAPGARGRLSFAGAQASNENRPSATSLVNG